MLKGLRCQRDPNGLKKDRCKALGKKSHLRQDKLESDWQSSARKKQGESQQAKHEAAKAANSLLGCIESLAGRLRVVIIPLYSAGIRLHLEYCIQCWTPSRMKPKRVQWRATKLVRALVL